MAAENDSHSTDVSRGNLLDTMLERAREQYVAEHGEEPPDELIADARESILRRLAKHKRDEHRDIYDALADE
ncbi:hypothetical protein OB955_22120 [Halobacteria archaeon AArc-m2/3/4]|uniref:Uncharacterized protein n=1 Tax=Natronoglomus mannanivorans TaxID=2979990 RepID=A0AAP2Z030_9EURY|nr:hypothetical protein [Halobacteria archaeon AArc-xg1-1]MCU4975395.1 hypothetical protein [Halobacteria archaeon AArc-m2/3/4]